MRSNEIKAIVDSLARKYHVFGNYQNDGSITYNFDKFQTERNQHNQLSGELLEKGIQAEVQIKIGRGRTTKGIRYAIVKVSPESFLPTFNESNFYTSIIQQQF